jgi:class 3 adenylate cyclase
VFGLQVNVAARISAIAEANEILASSVVRALCAPGRSRFVEPRTVRLKGVPGEMVVYVAVRATEVE